MDATRVLDPHHFNADPDPTPHQSFANLRSLVSRPSRALSLYLKLSNFDFNMDPDSAFNSNVDPDPSSQNNADPDPSSQNNADPDPQHCMNRLT
jgi:hypothetical protein